MFALHCVGGGNDVTQEFDTFEAAKAALEAVADRHGCGLSFEGVLGTHGHISKGNSLVGSWSISKA